MTSSQKTGLACGVFAYVFWGITPIYFKQMAAASPLVILSHRILGATLVLALILYFMRQWGDLRSILTSRRLILMMLGTTLAIAINWLTFIYCINTNQVLQSALGYYLNPLFTAMLGMCFLGERLRPLQWLALGLALAGVSVLIIANGTFPTLALLLAISFGFYGLLRKRAGVGAAPGLFFETSVMFPLAALYFIYLAATATAANPPAAIADSLIPGGGIMWLWLLLAGPITTIPLMAFNIAAKRLRLTTMGFLQYLGPSCQFLLALAFGEPLTTAYATTFILIWIGIAIYCADSVYFAHKHRPAAIPE